MNSKTMALGAALFSSSAALDFTALAFSDSIIDRNAIVKAADYPAVGPTDINLHDQFEASCKVVGGLSLAIAVGFGAAALSDLKVPSKE